MIDDEGNDGEIEVELDELPDDQHAEAAAKAAAEDDQRAEITPEDGIDALKVKLATAETRADHAERVAREAVGTVHNARRSERETAMAMLDTSIIQHQERLDALRIAKRQARMDGDEEAEWAAEIAVAETVSNLSQLRQGRHALEQQPEPAAPSFQSVDPVEQFASQCQPRSAAWVREHPDYVRNPMLQQKMLAAHNLVTADGVVPDTDEYFERVEEVLGIRRAEEPAAAPVPAPRRAAAPAAAPPSRSGTASGQRPNTVRLTAEEREIAALNGMTDQEYARNKLAIQRGERAH